MRRFNEEKRNAIFRSFWDCGDQLQQNQLLLGSIRPRKVARRRTKDENKPDRKQWHYFAGKEGIEVCGHTFMSIHGISESRVKQIKKMKDEPTENVALPDRRGKSKFVIIIFY